MAAVKPLNVGIIGYGMSAKVFHIPFITTSPSFTLHTIVQRSPTDASSAPKDHPSITHHTSTEPLFADPAVDLVIITTPPHTHFSLAEAALNAGKHVLVEKPFVPTAKEATSLIDLAKKNNLVLCVYQNRRWDTDFASLRQLIQDGTLGRVAHFNSYFDRHRPERPTTWKGQLSMVEGGGPLYDLGSHLIDQIYSLFGKPTKVTAQFSNLREGKVDKEDPDSVFVQLLYPDGLVATAQASIMSIAKNQPRFTVRGTKASFTSTGLDPQENQLKAGTLPNDPTFGMATDGKPPTAELTVLAANGDLEEKVISLDVRPTYVGLFEGLAKAVRGEGEVPVSATQARDVLAILEAARRAANEGESVSVEGN